MARIVTKFKFLKPNSKQSVGGYARCIATRDGVEKIDNSKRYLPSTEQQKVLISKLLKDFPNIENMLEYKEYLEKQTIGSATELISRVLEDNLCEIEGRENYAKYIATRPRVEKIGSHGLFTDDGVPIQLSKVIDELNSCEGNIWTAIISLRREDAERLGFNTGDRWRDLLRSQTETISKNFKIQMGNLQGDDCMSSNSTNISIRMNSDLKMAAEQLYAELGMNLSTAFNIFVRQSLREGGIPFKITTDTPNKETVAAMLEAERTAKDSSVKGYTNLDELFEELNE